MNKIFDLIQKGESFSVEFKQKISSPKRIAKEIVAFSNTKGGYLLIGVDDKGQMVGVDSIKKENEALMVASKVYCSPPVDLKIDTASLNNKSILIVQIDEGKNKPYRCITKSDDERIYIRVRDKNLIASRDVIRSMKDEYLYEREKIKLDSNEKKLIEYLKKNEKITLKEFKKFTNISKRRASRILVQLVKKGLLRIHTLEKENFYTLSFE